MLTDTLMVYDEAISWLYSTQKVGIKLGLESISRLLRLLNVNAAPGPGGSPVIFHVAGTNGKGSVCAVLDAISRAAGYRTALFTSPHLVTFRERLRINGAMISRQEAAEGLSRIRELVKDWNPHPTFFELTAALALDWFQRQNAEVIVLETGLGGRLDATNALTPAVTAITSLSLDHRQYLGNTLEAIAGEKAGIFKPGVPVVSVVQPEAAAKVLRERAQTVGAPLRWVEQPVAQAVALAGSHQKINAALALAALEASKLPVTREAIERGLSGVVWPGRFQRIAGAKGVELVLDGAHNEDAARRLVQTWREEYAEERPILLLGVLRDKDIEAICREFAPLAAEFVAVGVKSVRACAAADLAAKVRAAAPQTPCAVAESAAEGLALAQIRSRESGSRVLIAGSLFLIGEILALLQGAEAEASAQ